MTVLSSMDVAGRADRVRGCLDALGVDVLLVTNITNVAWLTGFRGSNGAVLVSEGDLVLFTDGRYRDQAPSDMSAAAVQADLVIGTDLISGLVARAKGAGRVGLEADHITWADQQKLAAKLRGELLPTAGLLVGLRAIKDDGEIDRVRAAAAIADATLEDVVAMLRERPTERDVALALDHGMRRRGATSSAYETIVASGPNGALPHARPSDRVIEAGDLVVVDVGALVDGYRSDMTRTFVVGEPDPGQLRHLDVVEQAQAAGVAAVAAGVATKAIDTLCRDLIIEAGWGEQFSHGTGHGVGLDIHEQPRLNSRSEDVLEAGMLVTVEPGVYLAGVGGVRWEDLLLVTTDGAEVLTSSPKEPILT